MVDEDTLPLRWRTRAGAIHTSQDERLMLLGRLGADLLHDIQSLLSVIVGNAELIEDVDVPAAVRESVQEMAGSADRGRALTRRYLAFVRDEPVLHEVIELNALVSDLEPALTTVVGAGVRVILGLTPRPLDVLGDARHLEQAILNIAANARDAMPHGGELGILLDEVLLPAPLEVRRDVLPPGRYAQVCLRDDGVGMGPGVLARLFEQFFTTKGSGRGAGLGLHSVAQVMREHDGAVTIDSAPGAGTEVRLLLPLVRGPAVHP